MVEDIHDILRFSPAEQVIFERNQNVFAIIKTMEYLEVKYANGEVPGSEYDTEWRTLFGQLEMSTNSISNFQGIEKFMNDYNLTNCLYAMVSLREKKSRYKGEELAAGTAKRVFDITSKFIAPIDVLQLGITAVDEILPHIRDLSQALSNYPDMPSSYQGIATVKDWEQKMSVMKASDNVTEEQTRQLKLDLDAACQQFKDEVCK